MKAYFNIIKDPNSRFFTGAAALSAFFHIMLICLFIFLSDINLNINMSKRLQDKAIMVEMVSIEKKDLNKKDAPLKTVSYEKEKTKQKPALAKKALPVKKREPEKSIKKEKKAPLEKTAEPKSKTQESNLDSLDKTFEQLRKKVEQQTESLDKQKQIDAQTDNETSESVSIKGRQADLLSIYKIEAAYIIQENWAFSQQAAGADSDIKTSLVFKIMPDGTINDIKFTKKSGNLYLDNSAYNAIIKTGRVKPHPAGISAPYIEVGLRFTPEGIR